MTNHSPRLLLSPYPCESKKRSMPTERTSALLGLKKYISLLCHKILSIIQLNTVYNCIYVYATYILVLTSTPKFPQWEFQSCNHQPMTTHEYMRPWWWKVDDNLLATYHNSLYLLSFASSMYSHLWSSARGWQHTDLTLRVKISPKTKIVYSCMQYLMISGIRKWILCHKKALCMFFHPKSAKLLIHTENRSNFKHMSLFFSYLVDSSRFELP